jgi:beta-glucosidase
MAAMTSRPADPFAGRFGWAVGIEDTFVGAVSPRTGRTLDEYELTEHDRRWREDLDRIAGLGVRTLRYGLPWYRIEPQPDRFDWRWPDAVMEHLASMWLDPIVDLVHYGCPLWMPDAFVDPAYPERVAAWARAVAGRYRGVTRLFTPLNEPLVTAWFCGRNGAWPPYLRSRRGYVRVLLGVAHGMARTIAALRAEHPDAVIIQAEAGALLVTDDPALRSHVAASYPQQWLALDLVLGRVREGHPLWSWLVELGAAPEELAGLADRPERVDLVGVNFYPHMSAGRAVGEPGHPRRRRFYSQGRDLAAVLEAYHDHFGLPVMVTETSDAARVSRRERWLVDSIEAVRELRARGVPVLGYTWWPAFSLVDWRWRSGRRSLAQNLRHMGLWDLQPSPERGLERVPTRLVERSARIVAGGEAAVGPLAVPGGP